MAGNRFRNWQNAVDIDYLSLYIKTWFAFLSTVQELHPDAINNSGDGSLINTYKESISIPFKFREAMAPHIEKVFTIGYEVIKRDVPQSYFVNFYKIDSAYSFNDIHRLQTYRTVEGERVYDESSIKIDFKDKFNGISNPNLLITVKSASSKFFNNLNCYHVCLNIFLSDFIDAFNSEGSNRIFKSKDDCLNLIETRLRFYLFTLVDNIEGIELDEKEERKGYCNGLLVPLINLLRQGFLNENLFQSLPFRDFPTHYEIEGNQRKILYWFISFNYQIRNLLFHSIIDPFNSEWLKLFKHTYLALKELVEHNIDKIESQANAEIS
jgi:hypothetical protein